MLDFLMSAGLGPFTFFATLVLGFLLIELLFMLVGVDTRIGDDPGLDLDTDLPCATAADIPDGIALPDDLALDAEGMQQMQASPKGSLLDTLGLRRVPVTVWMALFSACFSAIGIAGQSMIASLFGAALPALLASAIVLAPAILATRFLAEIIGNVLPQMETTAISERSFGRRRGTVTTGIAKRGSPAEVRFTDTHGNLHYIMAEPLEEDGAIAQGEEVLILRLRSAETREPILRLIPLSSL